MRPSRVAGQSGDCSLFIYHRKRPLGCFCCPHCPQVSRANTGFPFTRVPRRVAGLLGGKFNFARTPLCSPPATREPTCALLVSVRCCHGFSCFVCPSRSSRCAADPVVFLCGIFLSNDDHLFTCPGGGQTSSLRMLSRGELTRSHSSERESLPICHPPAWTLTPGPDLQPPALRTCPLT